MNKVEAKKQYVVLVTRIQPNWKKLAGYREVRRHFETQLNTKI